MIQAKLKDKVENKEHYLVIGPDDVFRWEVNQERKLMLVGENGEYCCGGERVRYRPAKIYMHQ